MVPEEIKIKYFGDTFGIPKPPPRHFRRPEAIEKESNAKIPNGGRIVCTLYFTDFVDSISTIFSVTELISSLETQSVLFFLEMVYTLYPDQNVQ